MADTKITGLAALAEQPADGDLIPIVDVSDTSMDAAGTNKKNTFANLTSGFIKEVVEDTTPQLGGDLDLNGNNIDFPTTANVSDCLDEDDLSSDSATALATQQSIKAYADTKIANVVEDTTPQLGGALDAQGNDINNGGVIFLTEQAEAEADVAGKGQIWVDTATPNVLMFTDDAGTDFIIGNTAGTQTLTNKTIDADNNTISNIALGAEATGASTDLTDTADLTYNADTDVSGNGWVVDEDDMVSDLATKVPTQQSVKAYVDGQASGISDIVEDATPQLGGNLDANGNTITNLDASLTAKGIVELATGAETNTGTDATRAVTPDGLDDWTGSAQITTLGTIGTGTWEGSAIATTYLADTSGTNTGDESSATDSAEGIVELATIAETNTGTDTGRVITPDGLAGSNFGEKILEVTCFDYTTDTETGDGVGYVTVPSSYDGMNLVAVHARVITAGTTGTTDIQIHNLTQTADMLSTVITIDSGETGSDTAATAAVIDGANDDVASYDLLRIDVDAVSTTAAKGLIVTLEFRLP